MTRLHSRPIWAIFCLGRAVSDAAFRSQLHHNYNQEYTTKQDCWVVFEDKFMSGRNTDCQSKSESEFTGHLFPNLLNASIFYQ